MDDEQIKAAQAVVTAALQDRKIWTVAAKTGLSRNTVAKVARGEGQATLSTLRLLASYLGVSLPGGGQ